MNILFITFFYFFYFLVSVVKLFIGKNGFPNDNSVFFYENFPFENAGYQYRANKWAEILRKEGYKVEIKTIVKDKKRFQFFLNNRYQYFLMQSMIKRLGHIISSLNYETVIVRRELLLFNDYGNLFLEKFLLSIHPNIILDFDDDISASKREPRKITSFGKLLLENGNKFKNSLELYRRFIVASNHLKKKVLKENLAIKPDDVLVIPTCVDYNRFEPKVYQKDKKELIFGWIGGNHNYYLLESLLPDLEKISNEFKIKLIVIGGEPFPTDKKMEVDFIPWSLETEVQTLKKIDVGLMPLFDDEGCRGKGGFKLIQYMGLGIVSLATGLTINNEIVDDGENGFLVPPGADWYPYLKKVILAKADFARIGANARQKIIEGYTFSSNAQKYIDFIKRS